MEKKELDYKKLAQERCISIADLIEEIFRKLGLVILLAVIFAALLGGYKYAKDLKSAKEAEAVQSESTETALKDSDLSEEEQTQVSNYLQIYDNMLEQQEYVDNSVLMQMDPTQEHNVNLQYCIELSGTDETDSSASYVQDLASLYDSYVSDGALASDLEASGVDLEVQYINELLSYSDNQDSEAQLSMELPETLSFSVTVIHANEDDCAELAEKVAACMTEYQSKLSSTVASHTLTLVDQSSSTVVDRTILSYKTERVTAVRDLKTRMTDWEADFSTAQLEAIDNYTSKLKEEASADGTETEEAETSGSVSISKKYVVLGAGVGIVLACLYLIVAYILRGSINKAEDLQYLYNLRILGTVRAGKRKSFFLTLWHRLIRKRDMTMSEEESERLIVSNLTMTCKKDGILRLLFGIEDWEDEKDAWLVRVADALRQAGIEIAIRKNLVYSADAFAMLDTYKDVVLVKKVGTSSYQNTVNELKACMEQDVTIIGTIVLE